MTIKIKNDEILLEDDETGCIQLSAEYVQNGDCGKSVESDNLNILKINTENNGVASYIVFSTERWALDPDNLEEFTEILKDFAERFWRK